MTLPTSALERRGWLAVVAVVVVMAVTTVGCGSPKGGPLARRRSTSTTAAPLNTGAPAEAPTSTLPGATPTTTHRAAAAHASTTRPAAAAAQPTTKTSSAGSQGGNSLGGVSTPTTTTRPPSPQGDTPCGSIPAVESRSLPVAHYSLPFNTAFVAAGPDNTVWAAENGSGGHVARVTTAGLATVFNGPAGAYINDIVAGPDGNMWAASPNFGVLRITAAGEFTAFNVGPNESEIIVGPDGNLWTAGGSWSALPYVAKTTTAGVSTVYTVNTDQKWSGFFPQGLAAGSDGNIWVGEPWNDKTVRITPSGAITEFPQSTVDPFLATTGPDGNVWFSAQGGFIGRTRMNGATTCFPTPDNDAFAVAKGPDGALWFAQSVHRRVGRMTTDGVVSYTVPVSAALTVATGADGRIWVGGGAGLDAFTP